MEINKHNNLEFENACNYLFKGKINKDKITKLNNLYDNVCSYKKECKNIWGGCDESIELVTYIRQLLCELNYIERTNKNDFNNWTKERSFGDAFFELIFNPSTVSKKSRDDYIVKDKSFNYTYDCWNYPNNKSHYYYNELDHYFTHLIGNIILKIKPKFSSREPGLKEIHLIFCSINKKNT